MAPEYDEKSLRPQQGVSTYLQYLPALYRREDNDVGNFLGRFLLGFEDIFSRGYSREGFSDGPQTSEEDELQDILGLEQYLDFLYRYFDPQRSPHTPDRPETDFLPWLFSWLGLEWYDDLSERELRRLLKLAVAELYAFRGTAIGLKRYLEVAANASLVKLVENEWPANMQIGLTSTIGHDTLLSDKQTVERLHCFIARVRVRWQPTLFKRILRGEKPGEEFDLFDAVTNKVRKILLQECPAHTKFYLQVSTGTMQIGCGATIGVDTFLARKAA